MTSTSPNQPPRLAWYCARTAPAREVRACTGIEALGLAVYLPLESFWRGNNGRRGPRSCMRRPLIPRYLFFGVREGLNRFGEVRAVDGVETILARGRSGPPQVVPWRALAIIQAVEGELQDEFESRRGGSKDRESPDEIIAKLKAAPAEARPVIILNMLGRPRSVSVKLADLQKVA